MGLHDSFNRINRERNIEREATLKRFAKNQLRETGKKRLQTCFMGSISSVEEKFGYLWGHGKPNDELTRAEKEFLYLWRELREDILNKGNRQLRIFLQELDNYEIGR